MNTRVPAASSALATTAEVAARPAHASLNGPGGRSEPGRGQRGEHFQRPRRAMRALGVGAQVALLSIVLVVVAAGGSALAGWRIVDGLIRQATTDRLNVASATFGSLYAQRIADAEIFTRQLSEKAQLAARITQRNGQALASLIEPIQTLRPSYSVIVADTDLAVLAKLIPPGRVDPGPSLTDVPGAIEALRSDETSVALVRRPDCQMIIAASVPVKNTSGGLVGLVHVRFPLDEDFVRQVKADTGLDLALYCGDTLVASTLAGQALGASAPPEAVQHVLEEGQEWESDQVLPRQTYRTRYVPLTDIAGNPAGMYAVSTPVQTLRDARNAILRYFLPVMLGIAAFALAIGYLGSALLTQPLRRLAAAAARIGSGDLESPVQGDGGRDEVAQLAERMEEMRRSLQQTYLQLRELNQLKEEYLFSVAHEVRTPLASLVASVEILGSDYATMDREQLARTVQRIERAAVRLNTLVENVLDAGSIRNGRFSIHPEPLALSVVAESVTLAMQPLLDEKRQQLVWDFPAALPAVLADERRVSQVLTNLIGNACKFGPASDVIRVSATLQEPAAAAIGRAKPWASERSPVEAAGQAEAATPARLVLVRVTDHGPGIPLPEQGELFERYFRASSSSRSSPGTGLGLAISKAIVEAHGGAMGLESEPSQGTTVWFTLPVATVGDERDPAPAEPEDGVLHEPVRAVGR